MRFRASLRFRATLAFALLGGATSAGLAGALYALTIHMEERLVAETLSAELEDYMGRYAIDPATAPPSSKTIRSFVIAPAAGNGVPALLYDLTPGLHRIRFEDSRYFAAVRVRDSVHFVVLYDDQAIRNREVQFRSFLLAGLLVMTLLSAVLGWWLARRVVYPVSELASRVARLQPEDAQVPLAADFPRDELGELANDFDTYQQRLAAFINRERAFTGDVSHELRTPLAVIEGAAEVLLADPDLGEKKRKRVERIARAAHEASELTSALLLLAREEEGYARTGTACDVAQTLKQLVDELLAAQSRKPVNLILSIEGHPVLPVEPGLLRVVLGNLIRNAYAYTPSGSVRIILGSDSVTITDTGVGMTDAELSRVFERYYSGREKGGAGIGLSLVKRICQRYGWQIDISSEPDAGTLIHLTLGSKLSGAAC